MRPRRKSTTPTEELAPRLKRLIVATLRLEGLDPESIGDDQLLFGEGLGLDSIDALELIVLLQQQYQIKLSNSDEGPNVFRTVRTMAEYIKAHQAQNS